MLVDLDEIRPQNETQQHFFLKQVGRAYLFKQGIRCIATEVSGVHSMNNPPFGTPKVIIDVFGIDKRHKRHEPSIKLQNKIQEIAYDIGEKRGLVEDSRWGGRSFIPLYSIKDPDEKTRLETEQRICYEEACESLGYYKELYQHVRFYSRHEYQMRGIEVKVSYSDFKNGFNMLAEYSYVLAPKGIVPKEELPKKVGLLEFDFDAYATYIEEDDKEEAWFQALTLVKRPKKEYDPQFVTQKGKKSHFERSRHAMFCEDVLFTIAQQNTEEHIFWNPHLQQINKTFVSPWWERHFRLNVGQQTPLGTVLERRMGEYTYKKEELEQGEKKKKERMTFYKFLSAEGVTKWIPFLHIEKEVAKKQGELFQQINKVTSLSSLFQFLIACKENGFLVTTIRDKVNLTYDTPEIESYLSRTKDFRLAFPFNEKPKGVWH